MGRSSIVDGTHIHLDDMLASQYQSNDWTQHTTNQNLVAPGTMHEKTSHETSLDLDSCFDHHEFSSASLRQPHQWMNTSGIWAQNKRLKIVLKCIMLSGHFLRCCHVLYENIPQRRFGFFTSDRRQPDFNCTIVLNCEEILWVKSLRKYASVASCGSIFVSWK